ncbi:MAG: thiamine ABC transporter substrate-binding protein [Desulfarculaceae bacterium]|nr:thiamine ABC transporter substrate-binding protein [Desulfarculaceae bacterium]
MKKWVCWFVIVLTAVFSGACTDQEENRDTAQKEGKTPEIRVMTHDSFSVSGKVISTFEKEHNVKVTFLKSGDAGEALNKAILAGDKPLADVFYGVDNTFLSRALEQDIFRPYDSPLLSSVEDDLKLDSSNRLLPVDYGDVCINYDIRWFNEKGIEPPENLKELILPRYKGLLAVENPATSSPGLAFLLTTVARFGEPGYLDFWENLEKNGVVVTSGWEQAYWGKFSAASEGNVPMVVSYASSPAAEVHFSEEKLERAPTGVLTAEGSAFRQVEFAGIFKGTEHPKLAENMIDFFLSKTFQEDIPLQMFVFPANREAQLPEVFKKHAALSRAPAELSFEKIAENRDKWIAEWTQAVLH